nr:apolipoprotein N-acyltransferase [Tsuneonella mangrovi]
MDRVELPVRRASHWLTTHPRIAALGAGLLAALGFPPLDLWPLALLGMAALAALVAQSSSWRRALAIGWLFGVAHYSLANNWIATAFSYQAAMPAALGWLAVPLLSLYLAVYPALAAAAARAIGGQRPLPVAFALAGSWIVAEWLKSWVFTGYAWDPFGLVFLGGFSRPGIAALLPWLGTYGLSGLAVLVAGGIAWLVIARAWWRVVTVFALLAIGMYLPSPPSRPGTVDFTLVQPDIPQSELDNPALYESQFQKLAALTAPRHDDGRRLVLWPESGVPDYLREGYPEQYYLATTAGGDPRYARQRIARVIGPGSLLMTGAVNLEIADKGTPDAHAIGAYNVVTVLDDKGDIVGSYAKAHLVPYGEYLPMRWLLEPLGLRRLVAGAIDFLPGPGPRTLDFGPYGKAGMQICYEITFSGQVVDPQVRPDYIFNPSNDGWFGKFGPPQHFAQARMRAIEEGLPILRATTTGISGVIDAHGVVRHVLAANAPGRLDGKVPLPLPPTLFARLGNLLPLGWALLLLGLSLLAMRRRDR